MSVYTSRRKDASAEFIQTARNLRLKSIEILRKFPKSYRYCIVNQMLESCVYIYQNCIRANSIYIHKDMMACDFIKRHEYLIEAIAETEVVQSDITIAYEIVSRGNNFFDDKHDLLKKFKPWVDLCNSLYKQLNALVKNDRERYCRIKKLGDISMQDSVIKNEIENIINDVDDKKYNQQN